VALDQLVNQACQCAAHVARGLSGDEDLMPFVLSAPQAGQGRITVLARPVPQEDGKRQRFYETLFADEVRKHKATQIAFGYMAWMARLSADDDQALRDGKPIQRASLRTDRYEAIVIGCVNAEGEYACVTSPVQRSPDGTVGVGVFARDDNFTGGLIPEALRSAFLTTPRPRKPWWRFWN